MAVKFRHLIFRVLLSVCIVSFTVILFGKGWVSLEDQSGPADAADAPIENLLAHKSNFRGVPLQNVSFGKPNLINVAVVVCEDRFNDTVIMMKSAIAFTSTPLHFIILADTELQLPLQQQLISWETTLKKNITHSILDIEFPVKSGEDEWRKLFKPCASQRLFLPTLLSDVDSLLYVDNDVIFLRPLEDIWSFFYRMNSTQIAALTPEHEDFTTGWYNRFAKHPFYGPLGVNSGVMLMNLTRMRTIKWQQLVLPIYNEYKYKITWGDQDIINILFYHHPEMLYILPCEWNYRPDHCMYLSVCKTAEKYGVSVLHGNRGVFRSSKQPAFREIYKAFKNYELGSDMEKKLLTPLRLRLISFKDTNCGKIHRSLTKQLQTAVYSIQLHRPAVPNR